ncbi:IS1595 family transposase [Psychromonas sp. SA13A]|uniref:IS1595 family transposase n=2 Tax=Psychromonas TaxID=67572 RepID=UPI0014081C8E|nr:IS1595 family transposase [Psychromonas sp. SA13A]
MNTKSFVQNLNQITAALISMTPAQREVVHQSIRESQVELPTNELFQPIFDTSSSCPHCTSTHLRKWGKSGETQRYRCNHCAKTFNIKTKTPLARLRKCHLWEEYARCMELKLTLRQAASICHINLKTAFLWRHRFLMANTAKTQDKLSGIIEVDEFFMAYSEKGSKKLTRGRKARKRGGDADKRTKDDQVAILLSIDRSKHIVNKVLAADTASEIEANFEPHILSNSVLCSDGAWPYVNIAEHKNCVHKRLINGKNRVIENIYHIQTVNGAITHFKSWVVGKMKGVATKYLPHYLTWFRESSAKYDFQQILLAAYR